MIHTADLYQAFFNTVGDLIFVFVVDAAAKTIVEANTQAINGTGFQHEELKGLAFDRLFRQQEGPSIFFEPIDEAKRSARDELLLVNLVPLPKCGLSESPPYHVPKSALLKNLVQSDKEFTKVCTHFSDNPRINECQTLKFMM